ncbi:MAG TPA: hypothetical protein VK634_15020 [Reyranella sp.]|nr:hypothetical protein [Reyranella sp.]HTE81996.1 hypothetical protein [Reyranella sp.]
MQVVTTSGLTAQQLGESTAKWLQRVTIETAMTVLRQEVGKGFDNEPVVITDGVPRRDPELVKPYGRIEFAARANYAEVVLWTMNQLWRLSPILTRRYINSHVVMINGVSLGTNSTARLRAARPGDRIQIVNTTLYAKKIEGRVASRKRGVKGLRGSSPQAPNGVYRAVQKLVVQRYGRSIFVDYKFVKLDTGAKVWGFQGGKRGGGTMKLGDRRRVRRDAVFPALQFFIKPTGLTN